jgi:hypothetical protein
MTIDEFKNKHRMDMTTQSMHSGQQMISISNREGTFGIHVMSSTPTEALLDQLDAALSSFKSAGGGMAEDVMRDRSTVEHARGIF